MVCFGDEIFVYYDPMIAKLIVWDEDRLSALRGSACACGIRDRWPDDEYRLSVEHCVASSVRNGDIHTGFIERDRETLITIGVRTPDEVLALAALAFLLRESERRTSCRALADRIRRGTK